MPQTSYSVDGAVAVPGMLADSGPHDIATIVAGEDIPAGRFVYIDTATDKAYLPNDTDNVIYGVALYVDTLPSGSTAGTPSAIHKAGKPMPVLRKGRVWVDFSGGTATPEGTVRAHCDDASAPTLVGKATASAASTDVISPDITGAKWGRKTGTSALKVVDLNK